MRLASLLLLVAVGVTPAAAPVPVEARTLVARLSDPSQKVRDESLKALRDRPDAAPWLRRAARSTDADTAQLARALLTSFEKKRQEAVPAAMAACIRDGHADLFIEWHQYWKPASQDDLWPVGMRAGKAGLDAYADRMSAADTTALETALSEVITYPDLADLRYHDGPVTRPIGGGPWRIRTDQLPGLSPLVIFASVAGPMRMSWFRSGYYFGLGDITTRRFGCSVVVCDGVIGGPSERVGHKPLPPDILGSFVACRGSAILPTADVVRSVLLVDGDIDLSRSGWLEGSYIRATGEIRLPKKVQENPDAAPRCKFVAHAKNATAPFKFFELSDVGLALADDEEGLVVTDVKEETPFGYSGLAKGDIIRAIDDVPAGHSELFRKHVRKAMVVHGNCLLTVTRGSKQLDLAVQFPLPK